jgi:SH3 domain-containing YSC84-like protein 1
MKRNWFSALAVAALALGALTPGARAQSQPQQVVDEAQAMVQETFSHPGAYVDNVRALVKRARAVVIVPNLVKAGFIFGAEGGTGVLLVHEPNGHWSAPAFYNMGAASFGFQAGVQDSKVFMIFMNDRALNAAFQEGQIKLGAGAGLAIATIGAGANGSINLPSGADIYTLSSSAGLFGGVSIDGGVMGPNHDWDALYYGRPIPSRDIVLANRVKNPGAGGLRAALSHL